MSWACFCNKPAPVGFVSASVSISKRATKKTANRFRRLAAENRHITECFHWRQTKNLFFYELFKTFGCKPPASGQPGRPKQDQDNSDLPSHRQPPI
jgi:hypothetical protein